MFQRSGSFLIGVAALLGAGIVVHDDVCGNTGSSPVSAVALRLKAHGSDQSDRPVMTPWGELVKRQTPEGGAPLEAVVGTGASAGTRYLRHVEEQASSIDGDTMSISSDGCRSSDGEGNECSTAYLNHYEEQASSIDGDNMSISSDGCRSSDCEGHECNTEYTGYKSPLGHHDAKAMLGLRDFATDEIKDYLRKSDVVHAEEDKKALQMYEERQKLSPRQLQALLLEAMYPNRG